MMGYFYALKDLDWAWDDKDEGRAIVVEADTPEGAIAVATELHLRENPGAGGITWSVARIDDIGFGDAEWGGDNVPTYEAFKHYSDEAESLGSQVDRLASFIMAEVPGEPSQSEGAVDTAIRWMRAAVSKANTLPDRDKSESEKCSECAGTGFKDKDGARLTLARTVCGKCGGSGRKEILK